ncbi:unnamed protein product [Peronospora destructor]|uniref:Uncharacterized protein n=1 Tax=Peronospora destructor TaxID=86335 RepID=A0AAV0UQZ6_9STRA|nr:unnamed protein product [Peronospora destructor]
MQRRELRPKRELLSLLQRLNDCVRISARRMYTQQMTSTEMLQRPLSDTRRRLPELCLFVDSLLPITSTTKNNSIVCSIILASATRFPSSRSSVFESQCQASRRCYASNWCDLQDRRATMASRTTILQYIGRQQRSLQSMVIYEMAKKC